jgi:hypothetical protein
MFDENTKQLYVEIEPEDIEISEDEILADLLYGQS